MNSTKLLNKAIGIKTYSIVTIILCCLFIGFLYSWLTDIIYGIIILSTDWKNEELNNRRTVFGVFTIILLGPISSLIFSIKATRILSEKMQQKEE